VGSDRHAVFLAQLHRPVYVLPQASVVPIRLMAACDDPRRIRHGDEDHLDCRVCDHLFEGIKAALCLWLWDQIGEGFLPVQTFVPFVEAAVWVDAECLAMP